jgi:hypothetical protein
MLKRKTLGFALFGLLAIWIGYTIAAGGLARPTLPILGIGSGFEGNLPLPKSEIEAALDAARKTVFTSADRGYAFRVGSRVAAWLAFLATAAITLVAGWYGQAPNIPVGAGQAAADTSGLPRRSARLVTLLAALAAVLTAGGGLATQEAETLSAWARDRQRDVVEARTKVISAPNAADARTILDDLALKLKQ